MCMCLNCVMWFLFLGADVMAAQRVRGAGVQFCEQSQFFGGSAAENQQHRHQRRHRPRGAYMLYNVYNVRA